MKSLIIDLAARSAAVLAASLLVIQVACSWTPQQSRNLVDFVAILDQAEPIDAAQLSRLFGQKVNCADHYKNGNMQCDAHDFEIAGAKVDSLDFRTGKSAGKLVSILILNLSKTDCLDVMAFDRDFGEGFGSQDCTDGVICLSRVHRRKWGLLSIGLRGDHWSETNCAKDVILDTNV